MIKANRNKALIVNPDRKSAEKLSRLLKEMKIKVIYESDSLTGIELVSRVKNPFSLIFCVQEMETMMGYEFFEKVRELAPETIRFLITENEDIDTIVQAINRGAIHHYVKSPWEEDKIIQAVHKCLTDYQMASENEKLLNLAKSQNLKLYELIKELRDKEESHKKKIETLDLEIECLKFSIDVIKGNDAFLEETAKESITEMLEASGLLTKKGWEILQNSILYELMEQFNEIAIRNGFKTSKELPGANRNG